MPSKPASPSLIGFIKRWGPALAMMAAIFGFSSLPSAAIPGFGIFDFFFKTGGHMLGYALLAATYAYALGRGAPDRSGWLCWAAWVLAAVYAAVDEVHQSFVSGRSASPLDIGVDAIGALLGLWFYRRLG